MPGNHPGVAAGMTQNQMHAAVAAKAGGPEVFAYQEVPVPRPGPGRVLVRVAAVGVNFIDTYLRSGVYPRQFPTILGGEGAGTVEELGEGVTGLAVGDRVAWADGNTGAYAEFDVVSADRLVAVPEGIELETAAAAMLQGMTAHYLVNSTWPLKAGETALVHAAAGGMGQALTQLAKAKGARVIGTTSSAEKERIARAAGADEVIRYTEVEDLAAEVRALTGGLGVDVVYDGVGKDTYPASLDCLKPLGLFVSFGNASGSVQNFDLLALMNKGSLYATRPTLQTYVAKREDLVANATELFDVVSKGIVKINVNHTYALKDAAQAHRDLEGRKTTGSIVLLP